MINPIEGGMEGVPPERQQAAREGLARLGDLVEDYSEVTHDGVRYDAQPCASCGTTMYGERVRCQPAMGYVSHRHRAASGAWGTRRARSQRILRRRLAQAMNHLHQHPSRRWAAPAGLDLSPRGRTRVDLLERTHPDDYAPGGLAVESMDPEHRPAAQQALQELQQLVRALGRAEAAALLEEMGQHTYPDEGREDLRVRVQNAIMDRWFPPEFVRPGPPRGASLVASLDSRWAALSFEQATMPGLQVQSISPFAPSLMGLPQMPTGVRFEVEGYHLPARDNSFAGRPLPLVQSPDRAANIRVRLLPLNPEDRKYLPMLFVTPAELMEHFDVVQAQPIDDDYDPNPEMPGESVQEALARQRTRVPDAGQTRVDRPASDPYGLTNVDIGGTQVGPFGDAPTVVR